MDSSDDDQTGLNGRQLDDYQLDAQIGFLLRRAHREAPAGAV
jgi:hypothetical protein